jgi:hypothetical protein
MCTVELTAALGDLQWLRRTTTLQGFSPSNTNTN